MTEFEDRLRDGLNAEAARVSPAEGLSAIRGRTAGRSRSRRGSTRRWPGGWQVPAWSGLAAAAVVAAVVAGVTGLPGDRTETSTVASGPSSPTDATDATAPSLAREVTVWVVSANLEEPGSPAYLYPRQVPVEGADLGVVAVEALLAYAAEDVDGDDINVWHGAGGTGPDSGPLPIDVVSVEHRGGMVTVDFSGPVDNPWPSSEFSWVFDPALLPQQLVRTVQDALDTNDPVLVTQDGQPVDAVLTAPVKQPIQADDEDLAPVYVTSPTGDVTINGPLIVTGESNTFEATVNWRVLQDGDVVRDGYAMGGSYGEWEPFRFRVDLPPGSYTVEVFEASAEDGSQQYVNTIRVTVE